MSQRSNFLALQRRDRQAIKPRQQWQKLTSKAEIQPFEARRRITNLHGVIFSRYEQTQNHIKLDSLPHFICGQDQKRDTPHDRKDDCRLGGQRKFPSSRAARAEEHKKERIWSTICKISYCSIRLKCEGSHLYGYEDIRWVEWFFFSSSAGETGKAKPFPFIIIYICKYECEMRGVFKCVAIFLLSRTVLF